jgi:putative FmdB family regulatory protein
VPLYEYSCQSCEECFEVLQTMGADARGLSCPECGGVKLEKQHSRFSGSASSPTHAESEACPCGSPMRCGAS